MRVQHGGVERSDEEVEIGQHDGHGTVDDAIGAVDEALGLVGVTGVVASRDEWAVREVELLAPGNEYGSAGGGGGDVRVVGPDGRAWCIPLEEDLLAWEGKGLGFVVGHSGSAAVTGDVQILAATGDVRN